MRAWNLHRLAAAVCGLRRGLPLRGKGGGVAAPPKGLRARGGVAGSLMIVAVLCAALVCFRADGVEAGEKTGEASMEKALEEWRSRGEPVPESLRLLKQVNSAVRASAKESPRSAEAGNLLGTRSRLFESACARASAEELRALGAMIPELAMSGRPSFDADVRLAEGVIAYGTAVFEQEVNKLKARPANLKMSLSKAAPPPELEVAPKGLREAWLAWRGASEAFEKLTEAAAYGESAQGTLQLAEIPGIQAAVLFNKLIPAPEPGLWRHFLAQDLRSAQKKERDEESTRRARHRGILLSLLAEGRMKEAVGVVCLQLAKEEGYPTDRARKSYATLAREFLTALGLDWELTFTGFLLGEGKFGGGALGNTEAWLILAAHGSPRGVQLGLDWITYAKLGAEDARPFLLRVLGPEPQDPVTANDPRPKRAEALPAEARAKAVALLAGLLDPGQPVGLLSRSVDDVPHWLAKDLEGPLKRLLAHRTHEIALRALWLLKKAELVGPGETIAPPKALGRVRLIVDGAPLANTSVAVQVKHTQQRFTTSADGELVIPQSAARGNDKVDSVFLSASPELERLAVAFVAPAPNSRQPNEPANQAAGAAPEEAPKPWFGISVPINDENTPQEVSIRTGELEIGLKGNPGVAADAQISVMLMRSGGVADRMIRKTGKPGESVVFPRVQVGTYRMLIQGDTLALPAQQEVHVTKMGSLKLVELKAGRSVRAAVGGVFAPNARIVSMAKLRCDGVEVKATRNTRPNGWDGLPLGKYQLRIPSTTELEEIQRARGGVISTTPKAHRHAGREVEFVLTPESPNIVDLGVIQLEPEAVKEEK